MSTHTVAVIDACSTSERPHAPHLRQHMWPRQDGKPHPIPWLWCLGEYDQQRQNRRVVIRTDADGETLVGEGLTVVGSAYREPREPGECGECREPEDFDWDPIRWEGGAPVIVCHVHAMLAPGWAYDGAIEVGETAWKNEPILHEHEAAATESHPARNPSYWAEFCRCGKYRYRVLGGPWAPWEQWDDEDGPNPALASA